MRGLRLPTRSARRGLSLVEVVVVTSIVGILLAVAAPSFQRTVEVSRADVAAGRLRALWVAERVWRLDHDAYADEATLSTAGLIDPSVVDSTEPYDYEVTYADGSGFIARAVRIGSSSWTGYLQIDAGGAVDGIIYRDGVAAIRAGYQFTGP
jgi:prepilin-type N-terminal cleavage/methylation domain-containing protein